MDTVGEFAMPHSTGRDLVTGEAGQYALGFQAKGLRYPFLSANAFGHNGSAGSESFADPVAGIAFGPPLIHRLHQEIRKGQVHDDHHAGHPPLADAQPRRVRARADGHQRRAVPGHRQPFGPARPR